MLTRRQLLAAGTLGAAALSGERIAAADDDLCRSDLAIDTSTALLYPEQAPLIPAEGQRDAKAVWAHVPRDPEPGVLIYFHGHNNYVTVDATGKSRVPDWAETNDAGRRGAAGKPAAPLFYGLDRLPGGRDDRRPVVLVPEVSRLATGSFWAIEPRGQYADPARLGALVGDCFAHLSCLHRPGGDAYLATNFAAPPKAELRGRRSRPGLRRVYLCGHSGAGLPLEEAASSSLLRPNGGVPTDLWLFDCTYWSQVNGFVRFCREWQQAKRLVGEQRDSARFVCVYRPHTQTEEVADALRSELASVLAVPAESLVVDHTRERWEDTVRPRLTGAAVTFVRTDLPHDEIPTYFIPRLLATAAK